MYVRGLRRAVLGIAPLLIAGACSSTPSPSSEAHGSAVASFPGCSGSFNTQPSPSGEYYATDFGCSSNPYFTDPGDACGSAACIQSAYDQGVCPSSESNADCQRAANWYSIGGASYGCGARLRVENPANGKAVIVMVLDNGPSCTVENEAGFWVLDVSYPTIMYLFGSEEGYSDHALINAEVVSASTPLGPTGAAPADAGMITTTTHDAGGTTTTTVEAGGSDAAADASADSSDDAGYGSCEVSATGQSGTCIDTSVCAAMGGTSTADECPGPDNIQCCTGGS